MAEAPRELVVVEDAFIHKMLAHPAYLKAFPFLKQYAAAARAAGGCGGCGRKARVKAVDYTEVKRTIAAMPRPKQAELLALAGAKAFRLVYRDRQNRVVKLTVSAKGP